MTSLPHEHLQASIDVSHAQPALPHAWAPTHDVQFYESDDILASSIARFLVQGVRVGQPMVVIATSVHRKAFKKKMRAMGIDPEELVEGRDIVWLDARETLRAFMEGTRPSRELFEATVGSVFVRLMRNRPYVIVRAYGEMVDVLWREGKLEAAIELEELWNELAAKFSFSLLCAYSVDGVLKGECKGIDQICGKHARVLSCEDNAA